MKDTGNDGRETERKMDNYTMKRTKLVENTKEGKKRRKSV